MLKMCFNVMYVLSIFGLNLSRAYVCLIVICEPNQIKFTYSYSYLTGRMLK